MICASVKPSINFNNGFNSFNLTTSVSLTGAFEHDILPLADISPGVFKDPHFDTVKIFFLELSLSPFPSIKAYCGSSTLYLPRTIWLFPLEPLLAINPLPIVTENLDFTILSIPTAYPFWSNVWLFVPIVYETILLLLSVIPILSFTVICFF